MNLDDPKNSDIEGAVSAFLLSYVARSGVPLEKYTLQVCTANELENLTDSHVFYTPLIPVRIASLLIEYLETSFNITPINITTSDDVYLILSTNSPVSPNAYRDLEWWYLDWHVSTSLIDNRIREFVKTLLNITKNESYIYRGEPEQYTNVSSTMYRHYGIDDAALMKQATDSLLRNARRYEFIRDDLQLQALVQHYGGRTNFIDFSSSVWIALFFACFNVDSRETDGNLMVIDPSIQKQFKIIYESDIEVVANRIMVQKSVLVSPPTGVIEPACFKASMKISRHLKWPLLCYLKEVHDIHIASMFPDIHGFIREQDEHVSYHVLLEIGYALIRRRRFEDSIQYFEQAQLVSEVNFLDGQAEVGKARAFMNLSRNDDAIASVDRAIALLGSTSSNPLGTAHLVKAFVFHGQGRPAEAKTEVLQAIDHLSMENPKQKLAITLLTVLE